jgi:YHS domain-containing protein
MRSILVAALLTVAMATSAGAAKPKKAGAPKCPMCKMQLSAKKSKATPVALTVHGKTYYCCSACKMGTAKKK